MRENLIRNPNNNNFKKLDKIIINSIKGKNKINFNENLNFIDTAGFDEIG